jgi:hypothetical protein
MGGSANLQPDLKTYGLGMMPSYEVIEYLDQCGIEWAVESMWSDGCAINVTSDWQACLAMLKLKYPEMIANPDDFTQ